MLFSRILTPGAAVSEDGLAAEPPFFRCCAFPLREVKDPTGAGDSFLGALAGQLASLGHLDFSFNDLRDAVVRGIVVASFTCEEFSTRSLEGLTAERIFHRMDAFRRMTSW
jgi:sugar/nucleoside kinase (ribokinase family)